MTQPSYGFQIPEGGAGAAQGVSPSMLAQLAQALGGTAAIPEVQRSEYLARALDQMRGQGANIRTPAALGTNLLAEALLQFGQTYSDRQLLKQINAGQAAQMGNSLIGTGLPGDPGMSQPPAGASAGLAAGAASGDAGAGGAGASQPPASPPVALPSPAISGGASSPVSAAASPGMPALGSDRDLLARALVGEAGDSKPDELAAMSVIANRSAMSGRSARDELFAPHQFEAVNNPRTWSHLQELPQTAPAYQQALSAADQVQAQGPVGNWDHFYSPGAQSALGRDKPAWDDGTGQPVGRQLFFAQGYGGKPAMQRPGQAPVMNDAGSPFAQGGAPAQAAPQAAPPTPQPVQVTTGPGPSMPPAQPSPFAAPGQGGQPQGPPTGAGATPQEIAIYQAGMRSPPGSIPWQRAMALAQQIQARHSAPIELNKGEYFDHGQARSVHQLEDVQSSAPNNYVQRDPVTHQLTITGNPAYGAVPGNTHMGPDGAISANPIAGAGPGGAPGGGGEWSAPTAIPGQSGLYITNRLTGEIKSAGTPAFTPKDLGERLTNLQKSPQYIAADNAVNMFTAASQAAARPGGISDVELRDFAARQFSGGVARQFNVGALDNAQGPWASLKQFGNELYSGQHLSPGARQAILQAMHDDAVQAQQSFAHLSASDEAFAQGQGMSLKPYLTPLSRDLGPVPSLGSIPTGAPGSGQPQPQQLPAGWPQGLNPNSKSGQAAAALIQQHGYHFQNGHLVK